MLLTESTVARDEPSGWRKDEWDGTKTGDELAGKR
jgi:hypothetical protein